MAKPKKTEGVKAASPSSGTTTPDSSVSTTPEPLAPAASLDATVDGLPTEGVAKDAPTTDMPQIDGAAPTLEGTTAPIGTDEGLLSATDTLSPVEPTRDEDALHLGATLPETIPGVPGGITIDELRELGIPLPGVVLSCQTFEDGQPEHGVIVSIHVELEHVTTWLRRTGRMWPIPIARIAGTDWTHVAEDYPPTTTVESFDRLHRTATKPPANAPSEWLSPAELATLETAPVAPALVIEQVVPALLTTPDSSAGHVEVIAEVTTTDLTPAEKLCAELTAARTEYADRLTAFFGTPVELIGDDQVVLFLRKVIGIPGAKEPPAPKCYDPLHVALGIPDHYTLCEIKGLGSISGHGRRSTDGKVMEEWRGGSRVYFPDHTVRKLKDLLETDPTKFKSKA